MNSTQMTRASLKDVQMIELKILREFDRVCKKHGIQYALTGGSLLGAIRHKGFIPWDDDIDVWMTCEEFEKFRKVADELDGDFEFYDYEKSDKYFIDFVQRIYYRNSEVMGEAESERSIASVSSNPDLRRLGIDIFVGYKTQKSQINRQLFGIKTVYGMCMRYREAVNKANKHSFIQSAQIEVLRFIGMFFSLKKLRQMFVKQAEKYNASTESDTYFFPTLPIELLNKYVFPKEYVEKNAEAMFENTPLSVPGQSEKVLCHIYGNWEKLPPENEQIPLHMNSEKIYFS